MTQAQLATEMGLSDFMTVSRWERGEHRPSLDNLIALSEALGVPVANFYMEDAA